MNIMKIGIDLAKNVFQIHGVDRHGKVVVKKQIKRDKDGRVLRQASELSDRYGGLWACAPHRT